MATPEATPILRLTATETAHLKAVCNSRSVSILRARRAAMLLDFCNEVPVCEIARSFRTGCAEVERYLDKAILQEVLTPREKVRQRRVARAITPEAAEWVRDASFQKPGDLGYSFGQWSHPLLAMHVRNHCRAAGHNALAKLSSGEVSRLLARHEGHLTEEFTFELGEATPEVLARVSGSDGSLSPGADRWDRAGVRAAKLSEDPHRPFG